MVNFFFRLGVSGFSILVAEAPKPLMNNAVGRDLGIQTVFFF